MQGVKKIVIIGPESTGKSTLCKQLADHYKTVWCPEYAREYLLTHGMNYTYEELLTIAKGQLALEDEYLNQIPNNKFQIPNNNSRLLQTTNNKLQTTNNCVPFFVDTDMYVMKVWCEYVFNKCHSFILDTIVERSCDLYLLCNIDLPWVKDELREYPDLTSRQELYYMYKDILINQQVPWVDVNGDYEERLNTAIKAVGSLLTSS